MKPQRFFWILIAILVVLSAAGGAGYYFAIKYLGEASTKLQAQYVAQNDADAKLDEVTHLKAQYSHDVVPVLTSIEAALPRTKNQTEILAQLQRLSSESGLTISSVAFPNSTGPSATSQAVKSGLVLALPVSFQTAGTYAQLETFLSKLESLNRYTSITNLAVAKADSKKISFSINLNAYFKP
ncbi:MAG: type 4a pilus biogenesis protein PilO [Candidatus Saccharibacteria bacterium]